VHRILATSRIFANLVKAGLREHVRGAMIAAMRAPV
jgi:hypothetical protein